MFKYIRRWARTTLSPSAELYKYRFAIAYAIVGWNAAVYTAYLLLNPGYDLTKEEEKQEYIAKLTERKAEVRIITLKGLHKQSDEVRTNSEVLLEDQGLDGQNSK